MSNYTITEGLVCELDRMENLTESEFRATAVVSLFGMEETNFQICVDEEDFDSDNVVNALRSGCIENTCFNVYPIYNPNDLILVSDYSKSEIEKSKKKIENIYMISSEDCPNEHIVMLTLKDLRADGRVMLVAQHVVER